MAKCLSIKELRTVTIAGIGLLGGSIGMAVRAAGMKCRRIGLVRRVQAVRTVVDCDAVDEATTDCADALAPADFVILATPIGRFPDLFQVASQYCRPGILITDVGSTKRMPYLWAAQRLSRRIRFVGSHPMAGGERTGVDFARADLFQGATCFVCPAGKRPDAAARLLKEFWEALGCRVVFLSPDEHDRCVARVSHVPHLAAGALIHLAGRDEILDRAGPGLRDATRIASGAAAMWRDILANNRDEVVAGLAELERILAHIRALLASGRDDEAQTWMQRAADLRNAWLGRILARGQGIESSP